MGAGQPASPIPRELDQSDMKYCRLQCQEAGTVGGEEHGSEIYIVFTFNGPTLRNAPSSPSSFRSFFVFVTTLQPSNRNRSGGNPLTAPTRIYAGRPRHRMVFRRKCLPSIPDDILDFMYPPSATVRQHRKRVTTVQSHGFS